MLLDEKLGSPARAGGWARTSQEPGRIVQSRPALLRRALVAVDALALAGATAAGLALADPGGRAAGQVGWALVLVPVVLLLFRAYGLYGRDEKRVGHQTLDEASAVFHALLIWGFALWASLHLADAPRIGPAQGLVVLALGVVAVLGARGLARWAVDRRVAPEPAVLVGTGAAARLLADKLRADRRRRLAAVGYLADGAEDPPDGRLPWLGRPEELWRVCAHHGVERAVMVSAAIDDDRLTELVREANRAGVKVSLLPSVGEVLGSATQLDDVCGVTMLGVNPVRLSRTARLVKRTVDVTLSAAALLVVLPLLPVVALAIKLDSPGPVFFGQDRMGRGGRRFRLYKLRTMVHDAEARAVELRARSAHPAWLMLDHDPRVTAVGRLLRVTSLDELPQLWNVLRGDMSLVGPRPMPLDTARRINGWGTRRLDLTPGITGLWQVLGRTSIPFEEMLKLDYLYVTNWSVGGDVRLLLRTVLVVLARRGAN